MPQQTTLTEQQIWNEAEHLRVERDAALNAHTTMRRRVAYLRDSMARLKCERVDADSIAMHLTMILDDTFPTG